MGAERVHAGLRRPAAARRPAGRPARTAQDVRRRNRAVPGLLAAVRPRLVGRAFGAVADLPLAAVRRGNLAMVLYAMTALGMSLTVSAYAQRVLGYTPMRFGLGMAAMTLLTIVGAYAGQAAGDEVRAAARWRRSRRRCPRSMRTSRAWPPALVTRPSRSAARWAPRSSPVWSRPTEETLPCLTRGLAGFIADLVIALVGFSVVLLINERKDHGTARGAL